MWQWEILLIQLEYNGVHNIKGYVDENDSVHLYISKYDLAEFIGLTSNKIKAGETILEIQGSSSVVDTVDATASASEIDSGKTAYVNGVKLSGTSTAKTDKEALEQVLEDLRQELAAITDADDAEKELNEIIQNLEDEILQLKTDKATLQSQVISLQTQIDDIENQIDIINNEGGNE